MIRKLEHKDRPIIESILIDTAIFSEQEIKVALELIDICLNDNEQTDYNIVVYVDKTDIPLGYVCFGKTPMTEATYDMYWIAVSPKHHNNGIGKKLTEYFELIVKSLNGKLLIVETSSREEYKNTRMFYIKSDYKEISRIENYYKDNDDLIVYGKYL
jgi:ribosomal protein S18 acetylase RimI-like enzyme